MNVGGLRMNRGRTVGVAAIAAAVLSVGGVTACSSGSAGRSPGASRSAGSAGTTSAAASGVSGSAASGSMSRSATAGSQSASTSSSHPSVATPVGPPGGAVPTGFTPYSSTFVSAADGWVLGSAPCAQAPCGSVVRTTDGGRSWRGIPAPKASVRAFRDLKAGDVSTLRFADRSNGWAAGRGLYVTHDGGTRWRLVHVGPSTGTVLSLETGGGWVYALIQGCPPSGEGTCPKSAQVYAARVGSDTWTPVSAVLRGQISQLLVVHGSTWYLGTSTGVLRASGTSKPTRSSNPCSTNLGAGDPPLVAVADARHLDALCATNGTAGGTEVQLYGSTDSGQSWKKAGGLHRMVPDQLTGMADNARGVLLISTASGGSYILRSTDDGTSLPEARVSAPTGGFAWADLGFTTTAQAAVTLPGHGFYLSRDAGKSWSRVSF
jgi:hypothetical protein